MVWGTVDHEEITMNDKVTHKQTASSLPMKKDFIFQKEVQADIVIPEITAEAQDPTTPPVVIPESKLDNSECIPSNWHIETTDDEDLIRVILNSHDLVLTRQQFSKILRSGKYNKGDFDVNDVKNVKNTG